MVASDVMKHRRIILGLCAVTFVIGLSFALYTGHLWEDYFITYKASRNFATGQSFGFDPQQRVHTYTSPIQGLLPVVLYRTTAMKDDVSVSWQFRIVSLLFLCGVASLSYVLLEGHLGPLVAALASLLVVTEVKTLDFTMNGQEPSYWIFFFLLALWALFRQPMPSWKWLGVAWGGAMWARPDSCIYIAAMILLYGWWAFRGKAALGASDYVRFVPKAGAVATLVYGPWFIFAWLYYGSPVPHPVLAKGLGNANFEFLSAMRNLFFMVFEIASKPTHMDSLYGPIYFELGGWPDSMRYVSRGLTLLGMLYWLYPRGRQLARMCSFLLFVGAYYLTYLTGYPFPWYFPLVTCMGLLTLVFSVGDLAHRFSRKHAERAQVVATSTLLVASLVLTSISAYQLKLHQQLIENGHRKQIGLWLKENAVSTKDTVFLESLGYIGFFSGLKMLDFPGLSSPEIVASRKKWRGRMDKVIDDLQPDWLVLRPEEIRQFSTWYGKDLSRDYRLAKTFDVSEQVDAIGWLPGRGYLQFDQVYMVMKRRE